MVINRNRYWVPLIIVLTTGVVMGFFMWNTWFNYIPRLYPPAFTQGRWISAQNENSLSYFRKELYISKEISHAWVMIGATDSFIFYINSKIVDVQDYPTMNVSRVYDIGHYLRPGKNVVGVIVRRSTYPGIAKMVIEGAYYFDNSTVKQLFWSDDSWKASLQEEAQGNGAIPWHSDRFLADAWSFVRVSDIPLIGEILPVSVHPDIFISLPKGKWIGHVDQSIQSAIFSKSFEVHQKVQGAWIRIGAYSGYDITINGVAIGSRDATSRSLDIYDVGPFIKKGINTIQAHLTGRPPYSSPQLILDGIIAASGKMQTVLLTDSTWQTKVSSPKQEGVGLQTQSNWKPAIILSDYSPFADNLVMNPMQSSFSIVDKGKQIIKMLAFILFILIIILLFWLGSSLLIYYLHRDITKQDALSINAIIQLPCLLFLGFVYLLQYDIRYDSSFPFQVKFIYIALILLLVPTAAAFLEIRHRQSDKGYKNISVLQVTGLISRYRSLFFAICIVVIAVAGMFLRLYSLDAKSLSHDETGMIMFANEILERGYPVKTIGPIEKPITTYELLPYPIALSVKIFGSNDFAARFPAVVFGVLTIILIYYIGVQLWSYEVGIFAAIIYAFSPFSILWGTNAFHPQQTQFFALLTSYLFYKAIDIKTNTIKNKHLYGAAVCFILTYFSWEGSGLLLPAFFSYLVIVKGKDISWLKYKHLWLAILFVGMAVGVQIGRRILLNIPYIVIGKGLSSESFSLFFLNPMYNPWFYIQNFLFSGNHIILTLLVIFGIPLIFKDQGIKYYFILLIILLLLLTNFIPLSSTRYVYFLQPFLILLASAITVFFISFIYNIQKESSFWMVNVAKGSFAIIFSFVLFLSTNTMVIQLYRIGSSQNWIAQMLPNIYWVDYRSTDQFVNKHIGKGDIVISLMPHTLEFYSGRQSNYYLQGYADRQVFYDVSGNTPGYLDKYIGSPVIRNLIELKEILSRYRRVWIVAAPYVAFQSDNDKQTIEYINKNTKIVYESYKTRVYLWEK